MNNTVYKSKVGTPTIKARYRNGVLELLEKIDLPEGIDIIVHFELANTLSETEKVNRFRAAAGGWKGLLDVEFIKEQRWLTVAAQDTADRLAALEAELPEDEVASWHRAMKQAAKPARYVPGKGVVVE